MPTKAIIKCGDFIKLNGEWYELLKYLSKQNYVLVQRVKDYEKAILLPSHFNRCGDLFKFKYVNDVKKRKDIPSDFFKEVIK